MRWIKITFQENAAAALVSVAIINAFDLDYGNAAMAFIAAVVVSL
jgi:hypothetical protein